MSVDSKVRELATTLHDINNITDDVTKLVCDSTNTMFKSKYDLVHYLQHFDLDLEVMSIYSIFFRDRIMTINPVLNCDTVKDSYLDYAEYQLMGVSYYDFGKIYEKYCGRSKKSIFDLYTWNNHLFFQPYERALQILDCLSLSHRINSSKVVKEREENARKLRELINSI